MLTAFYSYGQDKNKRKKIKSLKVAYLAQELTLSISEAEKFWPVYNAHQEKLDNLRRKERLGFKNKLKLADTMEKISEKEAKKFVLLKLDLDKKILLEKEDFLSKVGAFLSYKKIMKLHVSEREFARKLMRKYGKGRRIKE